VALKSELGFLKAQLHLQSKKNSKKKANKRVNNLKTKAIRYNFLDQTFDIKGRSLGR
jgi:hypothetical protein